MQVARRLSGGRGEYELAGEVGGRRAADVFGREAVLDLYGLSIATGVEVVNQGGKPRFKRLVQSSQFIQIHRQLAAILLMPKPTRADDALASGQPLLQHDGYALHTVQVSDLTLDPGRFVITLGDVLVKNASASETIDPSLRFARVRVMWSRRRLAPPAIADALEEHRDAVVGGAAITASVEDLARRIGEWAGGDPLASG